MLAVIKTGGKQYMVSSGDKLKIEKLDAKIGKEIIFDQILLLEKNKKVQIGDPLVKGAKVKAEILEHGKGKKVIIFKHKAKKRYNVKKGPQLRVFCCLQKI
jgi:large subunit ribosomal protein L21